MSSDNRSPRGDEIINYLKSHLGPSAPILYLETSLVNQPFSKMKEVFSDMSNGGAIVFGKGVKFDLKCDCQKKPNGFSILSFIILFIIGFILGLKFNT
jgi:hypothetical protein